MFVFTSYIELKNKYLDAQHQFEIILKEKESLFAKTQPKSPKWDKIGSPQKSNVFDEYLAAKEKAQIDERLSEIKAILDDREKLLSLKECELWKSICAIDKVYRMKYLENLNIQKIAKRTNYSRAQVYRMLDCIKKSVD